MGPDLRFAPATELATRIADGEVSPVELVDTTLDRIEDRTDTVNAYVTVLNEHAREAAIEAERAVEAGEELGPLHGIPVAFKDLSAAKAGVRHTFGSEMFADNVAEETSVFIKRLEAAGAIVLGKTNLPVFGYKPKTENTLVGRTSTPFDPDRNAGGSSGGSAAAVADGQVTLAQGGDAGGSVRIPSSFCGVYGLKPSWGRIPNPSRPDAFGAHTPMTDRGIHTRTVADAALMLEVMVGPHPRDPFSLPNDGRDFREAVDRTVDDLRVAYSPDFDLYPVEERVATSTRDAVDQLAPSVAAVDEVDLDIDYELRELIERVRYPVMQVKTAALVENIADTYSVDILGEHRDAFPTDFVERAEAGFEYGAVEYKRSDNARTAVYDAIQDVFSEYDILATPTVSTLPFSNDAPGPTEIDGAPVNPLAEWFLTWPINLAGHPAASLPAGFVDGLPVGLQLVGRRFRDDTVLAASAAIERVNPWRDEYASRLA